MDELPVVSGRGGKGDEPWAVRLTADALVMASSSEVRSIPLDALTAVRTRRGSLEVAWQEDGAARSFTLRHSDPKSAEKVAKGVGEAFERLDAQEQAMDTRIRTRRPGPVLTVLLGLLALTGALFGGAFLGRFWEGCGEAREIWVGSWVNIQESNDADVDPSDGITQSEMDSARRTSLLRGLYEATKLVEVSRQRPDCFSLEDRASASGFVAFYEALLGLEGTP